MFSGGPWRTTIDAALAGANVTVVSGGGGPGGLQDDGLAEGNDPAVAGAPGAARCGGARAHRRRRPPRDRASLPVPRGPGIFPASTPWR